MNRFEPVPEQISGMFRAMMPVFNNEDTTVITPLLATGNQVYGLCNRCTSPAPPPPHHHPTATPGFRKSGVLSV